MEIEIRRSNNLDEGPIKKCILELKKYEGQFDPDYYTDEESVQKLFEDINGSKEKGGEIFVAEAEGRVVGFMSLSITNKNDLLIVKKVDAVYISDISVLPSHRRMGIGGKLLDRASEFAKKKGIKYLKLAIFSENVNAKNLYLDKGFKDYETIMLKELI